MKVDTLIIGAGASGLALAERIPGSTVVSLDIGGLIRSFRKDGYMFDLGGHVYTTSDETTTEIMKAAHAKLHPHRKAFYSATKDVDGHLVPFPVQASMREKLKPEPGVSIDSFYTFAVHNFGYEFTNEFFLPFNERVWSYPMHFMDWNWIDGRVQLPSEIGENGTNWGMNSSFYYAPGEMIIPALVGRCSVTGFLRARVESVDIGAKKAFIKWTPDGKREEIKYKRLFDTTGMFVDQPTNRVFTLGIGLNKRLEHDFHWLYCHIDSIVHRVTLLSRYYDGMTPTDDVDSLLLEIPYRGGKHPLLMMLEQSDSPFGTKAIASAILGKAGFCIDANEIETVFFKDFEGYPIPKIGSRTQVAEKKIYYMKYGIFLAGRWGSHGYYNLQHIFQDAEAAINQSNDVTSLNPDYISSAFYYKNGKA